MIAALLMLAQIAPVPAEPKPIPTTIAAIVRNPRKFEGQTVRLHGYVNACQPSSCAIDERAATSPAGAGERLSIEDDQKFQDTVRPLLPTYVEFDARVNATSAGPPALSVVTLRGVVSPEPPPFENP